MKCFYYFKWLEVQVCKIQKIQQKSQNALTTECKSQLKKNKTLQNSILKFKGENSRIDNDN